MLLTKNIKTVPIETDKDQLLNELSETIDKMNELYNKVKKMLNA